ncbi:MAG: hypothetical protein PHU47_00655 [Candidatus ainarchaeum sp.]|nr:hypothetical protein [Candidatus ainarchaeum sp.]
MIPDPRIIENIKKLKSLGMSDKEIKDNLVKMGLSDTDCDELIKSSHTNDEKKDEEISFAKPQNTVKKETVASAFRTNEIPDDFFNSDSDEISELKNSVQELPDTDKTEITEADSSLPDITKDLDLDKLNTTKEDTNIEENISEKIYSDFNEKLNSLEKAKKTTIEPLKEPEIFKPQTIKANQNVWETGLATTINTKLSEIEQKQTRMEEYLKTRIDQELEKYKKIQETNKQLLLSKITDMISQQEQAANIQITKQLAMLKIEQAKLNKKIEEINSGKNELETVIGNVNELGSQLQQNNKVVQDNLNKLTITTTTKINAKLKEINDILALQSRITQGLVKNTQNAITEEVKKLNDFKEKVSSQINPKELYEKLSELESFKQKLAARYEDRFELVKREFLTKAKDAYKNEIEKQFLELNNVKNTIVSKTDPEIITKKINELSDFQKLLLESIDEKISGALNIYESAITQEIKGKIRTIDQVSEKLESEIKKIQVAQDKINEIDQFKEQFIAIIDKNIEKMNKTMKLVEKKIKDVEKDKNVFNNLKI